MYERQISSFNVGKLIKNEAPHWSQMFRLKSLLYIDWSIYETIISFVYLFPFAANYSIWFNLKLKTSLILKNIRTL